MAEGWRAGWQRQMNLLIGLTALNTLLSVVALGVALTRSDGGAGPGRGSAASPAPLSAPTAAPAAAAGPVSPAAASAPPAPASPEALLASVEAALVRAGQARGVDLSDALPTPDERAAAVAAGLTGPAAEPALARLKAGYARVGMPFPRLAPGAPSSPGAGGDPRAIEAWVQPTLAHLAELAATQGATVAPPDPAAVQAAIASGSFDAEPTRALIAALRAQHEALGVPFPEPGATPNRDGAPPPGAPPTAGAAPAPSGAPAASAPEAEAQAILRTYFTLQADRVREAARATGKDPASVAPPAALLEAAIRSGDIRSEASQVALEACAQAHAAVGLSWRPPAGG